MELDRILIEMKKKGWDLDEHFLEATQDFLKDLVDETEKQLMLGGVMHRFSKQDVIDCLKQRDKEAFDNPYQKYEHREIKQAIDIIKRLMPPSSFPNGA